MPAHVFAQLLESDVLDAPAVSAFRAILAQEGVALATLLAPGAQVPMRWFREVYPGLDADRAAVLGYQAGEQARLTSYSLLSLPLVSAGAVSEVLQLLEFMPLISNVISARFHERADSVLVMLTVDSGDPVLDRIPLLYCAAAVVRLLRLLSSETLDLTIHVAWPEPPGLADHPERIAGRLRFDAPVHYIEVPRATLEAVCRFSDPVAYQGAIAGLQAMMADARQPGDIAARVRQRLERGPGLITLDAVAGELNLSASTLKRRLAESGTCFSSLLEDTLRDRALLLLMDASLSLDGVASALGYSDLANFSHAFKRWTGEAPGMFRRRQPDVTAR